MRPEHASGRISVFLRTVECCKCTHVWTDAPGIVAEAFSTGCPRCGSVYYEDHCLHIGLANKPVARAAQLPPGHSA